ncbi:MAG: XdhC family protein [Candidatus Marinimicrobia bacterium]|jgi:xanthine dehydrogenase accessory factor|nr:XdhC family protein [Candidatus Neomarinimicrobiota bacterium]MBT3502505.1 XdhC family protein [Candidatus Neomarinimicrobiota bacterium]MBT3839198.1 XdhC family protein [Candidatus Neomarinimicrobiota bacterium]MBT4000445.1 XdhC family protein [Candidatus Neomarinimicrobiota bacterium]MBT4282795.1 XdhC family protein [Candidatus Neomarinimicrobiota bacterium]
MKAISYWKKVLSLLQENQKVFLAMVVDHTIHSPGTTGAKLLVTEKNEIIGTIGGGIMEYELVNRVQEILSKNNFIPEIHTLNHKKTGLGEQSGMICAGKQTNLYYVCEPNKDRESVDEIVQVLLKNQAGILSISLEGLSLQNQKLEPSDFQFKFIKNGHIWHYQEQLKNFNRIAIIGGGHCSLALSRVMKNLGYDITVFETRKNISTLDQNKFADSIQIIDDYKIAASQIISPEKTEVVILTTDVASDVRGLLGVLDKPFPFIGVMGSENKISEIKNRLKAEGISDQQLSRITAPVGLPMASNTPEEIAISIAAQLLQLREESFN